ncbi:MAG TPA: hypothetical protein VGM05_20835 [Planctomycetaceae bacterium]|jgi:hypothetical protein
MPRALPAFLVSLISMLFGTAPGRCDDRVPAEYLDKIDETPDFCQYDQRFGKLPGDGKELCAPVALSNSLVWLNQHGFPKLLDKPQPTPADQADLIRRLCREDFLGTDLKIGTPPKRVVTGIENYFRHAGYQCQVEQMGWRSSTHRIGEVPHENWMLRSCLGTSNVLINVGWYKTNKTAYDRFGGHWVTLVGFKEEHGKRVLLIHDPNSHGGNEKKTEPCHLISLPAHHLLETQEGESLKADGYFELRGVHLAKGADRAIIDEVVAFTPSRP